MKSGCLQLPGLVSDHQKLPEREQGTEGTAAQSKGRRVQYLGTASGLQAVPQVSGVNSNDSELVREVPKNVSGGGLAA